MFGIEYTILRECSFSFSKEGINAKSVSEYCLNIPNTAYMSVLNC